MPNTGIAFLGLCEKALLAPEGNTNLFKWNIIGLKNAFISNVYPLSLDQFFIGLTFKNFNRKSTLKIEFRDSNEKSVGFINIATQDSNDEKEVLKQGLKSNIIQVNEVGWTTGFFPLHGLRWVISEPGTYFVDQVCNNESNRIGILHFFQLDAAPFSPERITAIKSDPFASKSIRMVLGCKNCPTKFYAYAALERDPKLESQSNHWYKNLPDRFECECGNTSINLVYIRKNLHSYLGHNTREAPDLGFMPLYERSSLQAIRNSFANLLDENPLEEVIQCFLAENPILLHQFPSEQIITKPPILTYYEADFAIITPNKELVLIEIERTSTRLLKMKGDIAAPLSHAFDQVHSWLNTADEHRLSFLDSLNIERDHVGSIKGVVIAGRDRDYDKTYLRKLKARDFGRISFLTFDDILSALDSIIKHFEST